MKILSFGEIIFDVYPDKTCLGGAPLNFAGHIVNCNEEAYLLSSLGNDALASVALKEIKKLKINDKYIKIVDNKQTGKCMVSLDANKVPTFKILRDVAYDYLSLDNEIGYFDALAFGTLALRSQNNVDLLNKLINSKKIKKIYCDLNLRAPFYNKQIVYYCILNADILKVSDVELEYISRSLLKIKSNDYKEIIKHLVNKYDNLKIVLLTLGENGSYVYDVKENKSYSCPISKVNVVSTVGAGDSYGATFLVNYLKGLDIITCMKLASIRSGQVVSSIKSI